MKSMIIPKSYLDCLSVISTEGRESIIYLSEDGNEIFKIYSNSSFEKPTKEKIYELYQRQSKIFKTILPNGLLFTYTEQNGKEFIGITMKYFKNYVSIDMLDKLDNVDMNSVLITLINNIKELTDNNIYPTDLNDKNILVLPETSDVQIIDLDGDHCVISDKSEPEKMLKIYEMLLYRIYSPIRENSPEIDMAIRKYGYDILLTYGYSDELVKLLKKEEQISYEKLVDIVNELYKKGKIL